MKKGKEFLRMAQQSKPYLNSHEFRRVKDLKKIFLKDSIVISFVSFEIKISLFAVSLFLAPFPKKNSFYLLNPSFLSTECLKIREETNLDGFSMSWESLREPQIFKVVVMFVQWNE